MVEIAHYPIDRVNNLPRRAVKVLSVEPARQPGWRKSNADLARVFSVFSSLRLKQGLTLRAYLFEEGGNGNGIVWAMPVDSPFPEPDECPKLDQVFLAPPCPPGALDIMEAIEGDGTPWSYLCASLLAREIAEFGARWHGCTWSTHDIIGSDPEDASQPPSRERQMNVLGREGWQWLKPKPADWAPQVCEDGETVTVTFYTYSGLGQDTIYRHIDTYRKGSYVFESDKQEIARGRGGYVF